VGSKALKYSAVLIAIYLGVYYSTGSGRLIKEGTGGAAVLVRAFQGRK
jgi:hypothetical protein